MTWQPGRDKIAGLLAAGELEQVVADGEVAQRLLEDAARHLATATVAAPGGDFATARRSAHLTETAVRVSAS